MNLISTDTLLSKIVPFLSGCDDTIAKIALMDAARTFARESDIVIETVSYDTGLAPEYGRVPAVAVDYNNFIPHHFISQYNDNANDKVYVTYSLLPKSNMMPIDVLDRHYEAIVAYALFYLYNMPGKPWSSADMAAFQLQKYRIALGDAIRDNTTGGAVFEQGISIGDEYGFAGVTPNIGNATPGGSGGGIPGPQGPKGDKGDKGDTGATGPQGDPGKDGYTPVRGKDYWTEADKAEIKSYVDTAILNGAW